MYFAKYHYFYQPQGLKNPVTAPFAVSENKFYLPQPQAITALANEIVRHIATDNAKDKQSYFTIYAPISLSYFILAQKQISEQNNIQLLLDKASDLYYLSPFYLRYLQFYLAYETFRLGSDSASLAMCRKLRHNFKIIYPISIKSWQEAIAICYGKAQSSTKSHNMNIGFL